MKKKLALTVLGIAILLLLGLWLLLPSGGNIRHVQRTVDSNARFPREEIDTCMELVEHKFRKSFEGCVLLTLDYSEAFSNMWSEGWAETYGAEAAMVLVSSFRVDGSGGDGSFNPNDIYSNWKWVLTRDTDGVWTLQTWGYG